MAEIKCPKCGQKCECYYIGDVGITHWIIDEYCLVCLDCGYDERRREDGGESSWSEHPTSCPYCGVTVYHHAGLAALERKRRVKVRREQLERNRKPCPKCGKLTKCYHQAYLIGENRYDYFVQHCPDCGAYTRKTVGGHHYQAVGYDPEDCPICGCPTNEHFALPPARTDLSEKPAEPRVEEPEKDNELCPKCGKHKITCKYLGDRGAVDYYYTWEHTCPCGYSREFTQFGCAGQEREGDVPPDYGPGKNGGCPGPHN
jgi:hypothetical protein